MSHDIEEMLTESGITLIKDNATDRKITKEMLSDAKKKIKILTKSGVNFYPNYIQDLVNAAKRGVEIEFLFLHWGSKIMRYIAEVDTETRTYVPTSVQPDTQEITISNYKRYFENYRVTIMLYDEYVWWKGMLVDPNEDAAKARFIMHYAPVKNIDWPVFYTNKPMIVNHFDEYVFEAIKARSAPLT